MSGIEKREISSVKDLAGKLGGNGVGVELAGLLDRLLESRTEYDQMVKKSWEKFGLLFAKQIDELAVELKLSDAEKTALSADLSAKYGRRGYFMTPELLKE